MEELFKEFGKYIKEAEFSTIEFWIFPIGTIFLIWLLTTIGLKIIPKGKSNLKMVFHIHKFCIVSSLLITSFIIGLLCFWWATKYFAESPIQLTLLFSLAIALIVPIVIFSSLRNFFTIDDINEITQQPITPLQQEETIAITRKSYHRIKWFYSILLIGFLFLLFALNSGKNLITIVFDNSSSMKDHIANAIEALSKTFDNLDNNNEILLTTLDGWDQESAGLKETINEIFAVNNHSQLKAGTIYHYLNPMSAKDGLNQLNTIVHESPICEAIWKTYLYANSVLANNIYKNKVLIVITDGDDNVSESIPNSRFFFDYDAFENFYSPDKTFIINYSNEENPFIKKFEAAGCQIFHVTNTKEDYFSALNATLNTFINNWYLVIWVIIISSILTIIALLLEPKKIV